MQINLSTRHGQLSAETREKITEKLKKISRFYERLTAVELTVDVEHPESLSVELRVSVERADDFIATDTSESLNGSIDRVIHKIEQQLRKHKEKLKGHRTPGHRHQEVQVEPESEAE